MKDMSIEVTESFRCDPTLKGYMPEYCFVHYPVDNSEENPLFG